MELRDLQLSASISSRDLCAVQSVVDLHGRAFPGFFLSSLGPKFLHALYSGLRSDSSGILIGAFDDGRLTGFVGGTTEPAGLYSRLIRRRALRFAAVSVGPLLAHPTIVPRLVRALKKPADARVLGRGTALLMSIAVDPCIQCKGVGAALVEEFCVICRRRGACSVSLTTDRDGNDAVNQFYQRRGFAVSRVFVTPEGRIMNEYTRDLRAMTPAPQP